MKLSMKTRMIIILAPIVFILIQAGPCFSQTAETLIQAWEELQRKDPQTVEFRKEENNSYFFHTSRFPYQGRLVLLNTSIDQNSEPWDDYNVDMIMGVVEVDLPDVTEEFMSRHAHSYSRWQQNNYLYYDRDEGRWMSSREWQSKVMEMRTPISWWSRIDLFWVIFLVILLPALILLSRKTSRQMKNAMASQDVALEQQRKALEDQKRGLDMSEKSLSLQQETRDILTAILEELRKK